MSLAAADSAPVSRNRADIPAAFKWDFAAIYPDWSAWEAAVADMEGRMDAFASLAGTLKDGPDALLRAYRLFDEIGILQYRVFRYTQLQRDVDTRNADIAGRFQRVQAIFARFGTATAWFTPELLTLPQATVEEWIAREPGLAPYRFTILDNYRQQAHVLDAQGEKLLSYATRFNQTPTAAFQELSTSDIQFPEVTFADGRTVKLTPGVYQATLATNYHQPDRALAFEAYLKTYAAQQHTYAALYNGVLQRSWFTAQARNYATTLDAALDGNAIPPAVVENLVATARAGTAPLRRYLNLRKKLLGVDTYHLYDNAIPIFKVEKTYAYEQARDLVLASVAPLGADYQGKMAGLFSGGRVDVYENEGKRSGAYCAGVYGVGPYLLLNYNGTLDAVFTFAHEAGHALHTMLSYETQPFVTADYTIFVAEVASITNERFLLDALLEKTEDPKERFLLLQHAVDNIVGTFYTQVLFANFELEAHRRAERGEPVTATILGDLYEGLLKDYYGDAITIDPLYRYTWTRIPHFYNSPYYVYQYASCFASSAQVYRAMTEGEPAARAEATGRYLELLRSGGNAHPMDQLRRAGVDLAQRETVQAVVDQMDALVTRMEAEAARIAP